jgi:DnaJ family protein A protein 2
VPEDQREEAEIKFKAASQAYEILYDDDKRQMYDTHGMSAFDPSSRNGMGAEVDLDDILSSMFGMGMGGGGGMPGMPGFGGAGGRPKKPRKGQNEDQEYKVSLEDLYKGKTVKFTSAKNVICSMCKGSGGKEKAKPKQCANCSGQGRSVIPASLKILTFIKDTNKPSDKWDPG